MNDGNANGDVTRDEVEHLAEIMNAAERWRIFSLDCPTPHVWLGLPRLTTGEHHCEHCQTLFDPKTGAAINAPSRST